MKYLFPRWILLIPVLSSSLVIVFACHFKASTQIITDNLQVMQMSVNN